MNGVFYISYAALWAAFLAMLILLVGVLRLLGMLYRNGMGAPNRTGLQKGRPIPDVRLRRLNGSSVRMSEFSGRPLRVFVVAPGCPSCRVLLQQLSSGDSSLSQGEVPVIISIGTVFPTS